MLAKSRLLATDDAAKANLKQKIDQKQKQIEFIKESLSVRNKMQISPNEQINKRKQALRLMQEIQDLRQRILKLKG